MNKKIFCLGGATIDYKLKSISALERSTSNPITTFTTPGGVAHNVALNLAQLTDNIYLQCLVGNDSDGKQLLENAKSKGIDTSFSFILNDQKTSRYYSILDPTGEMYIALIDMEIYDLAPHHLFMTSWEQWEKDTIIFVDTNLPAALLEQVILLCKKKQLTLCIDPVSKAKAKKLPTSLEGIFLLKPDQHEATILANMPITSIADSIKASGILLNKGIQNVVISLGQSGYVVANDSCQKYIPVTTVDSIVDVTGAGDAFMAGILYELQQDRDIVEGCKTGAAAAALTLKSPHTVTDNLFTDLNKKK